VISGVREGQVIHNFNVISEKILKTMIKTMISYLRITRTIMTHIKAVRTKVLTAAYTVV
jgi:hypothetical protein